MIFRGISLFLSNFRIIGGNFWRYSLLNQHLPISVGDITDYDDESNVSKYIYLESSHENRCYCDEICTTFGDCCSDYTFVCPRMLLHFLTFFSLSHFFLFCVSIIVSTWNVDVKYMAIFSSIISNYWEMGAIFTNSTLLVKGVPYLQSLLLWFSILATTRLSSFSFVHFRFKCSYGVREGKVFRCLYPVLLSCFNFDKPPSLLLTLETYQNKRFYNAVVLSP